MKTPTWHIKLSQALESAQAAADKYGLPQTVFKTPETCGWSNTNPFSSVLAKADVHATILPANFFH